MVKIMANWWIEGVGILAGILGIVAWFPQLKKIWVLRKVLNPLEPQDCMEMLLSKMGKTKNNEEFLASISKMNGANTNTTEHRSRRTRGR